MPKASTWLITVFASLTVGGLIGAVGFVVYPNGASLLGLDGGGEPAVIAALKRLATAQQEFQQQRSIDADGDGRGEFGFLAELAGAARLRLDATPHLAPDALGKPLLPLAFATVVDSRVESDGYLFQVFLPGRDGVWTREASDGGGAGVAIEPDAAEEHWRAYAWPAATGHGHRVFFVDSSGDVRAAANNGHRYRGTVKPVPPDAAAPAQPETGAHAAMRAGRDGQEWRIVEN